MANSSLLIMLQLNEMAAQSRSLHSGGRPVLHHRYDWMQIVKAPDVAHCIRMLPENEGWATLASVLGDQ